MPPGLSSRPCVGTVRCSPLGISIARAEGASTMYTASTAKTFQGTDALPSSAAFARGLADLSSRNRLLAAIIIEAAAYLSAQPAGLDIFHQKGAGAVFGIGQPLMEHVHDREAGIEPDEIAERERPHRMIGAEMHGGIDRFDRAHALIEGVDRLVDHRYEDPVDDEGRKILGDGDLFAELLLDQSPNG